MLWIYLIGVIVIGGFAAYKMGKLEYANEVEDAFWPVVWLTVCWPAVLIIGLIVAPFGIPYTLGVRAKNKRLQAEKAEKNKA